MNPSPLRHSKDLLTNFWEHSGEKVKRIEAEYDHVKGSPVFTVAGKYTTRGWTEWTQGFEYGSAVLQFDATGDDWFLDFARKNTVAKMAPHVSHFGVHDHGFNNTSTYGNLLRLMNEGRIAESEWERNFYELALKISGASQARRWTPLPDHPDAGFIYSFNGPHSLFVDTIRSCRALFLSHLLGHQYMDEGDKEISLLGRAVEHGKATARYSVFYGEGRDSYDTEPGRTAHESVFNTNDGQFRCPNAQQGFSGFTTWTRGLAWAMTGFAEELELLREIPDFEQKARRRRHLRAGRQSDLRFLYQAYAHRRHSLLGHRRAASSTNWGTTISTDRPTPTTTTNRSTAQLRRSVPKDSSGLVVTSEPTTPPDGRYFQAGLTVVNNLFGEPYLSTDPEHQGLILHSIYHRPNGWDHIPEGSKIPNGESSMWGDYHAREVALLVGRLADGRDYRYFDAARFT